MKRIISSFVALGIVATGVMATPAMAQSRSEQEAARQEMKAGNVRSLRDIERRILPQMKGSEYLGPEYDSAAKAYRLKFMRKGRVVYVDVDARSGKIIRRSR